MPTGALVPEDDGGVAAFAERAESLGYDSVWTPELWGRDAFVALTRAAAVTDEVTLGTAIVNVYGRSPATLAQAAATLADAAGDRVRLGVGTSTPKVVEDLHGMAFENPPRRLHETVELAKAFLTAEGRVSYDGEMFEVADFPSLGADVPVYAAALGPANRRATGRTADGWLPHLIPFDDLGAAFETVAETARESGRDPADIETAPYVPSAVSEDPAEARAAVRGHLAYYVGSGEGYRRSVARQFPDAADEVASAWRDGDREGARAAVTDEMVDALGVAGTPEEARGQFDEVAALDAIDEPIVVIPVGTEEAMAERTVEALAPEKR
ncbi:LLM class flavin-dependent oxidoreductase [Salinibaculum marinum]|uniref:LLM class flavin-dependent oxidoreductase n=1 Tax=Salinibaculum marinum TaxID=3131993 RepID=UPI0030CB86A0